MRGKFVMLALALAVALVLWARVVFVTDENEAARSQSAASGAEAADEGAIPSAGERAQAGIEPSEHQVGQPAAQNSTPKGASRAGLQTPSVDISVMGRPFPVSESIFSDCENLRRRHLCEPNQALLAEMAEEPREDPWASNAERAIRSLVELEPGTDRPRAVSYTIRALECRTTICFLETASIMQPFHTQLFHFERAHPLRAGYSSFGIETDESGNKTHVTLTPFTRH